MLQFSHKKRGKNVLIFKNSRVMSAVTPQLPVQGCTTTTNRLISSSIFVPWRRFALTQPIVSNSH